MAGGLLGYTAASSGASITPVWSIAGALNHSRDGSLQPIDTARYTRASFRMYSSVAGSGVLSWYSCASMTASCYGAQTFVTKAGWNLYSFAIVRNTGTPVPWSGLMRGLRFQPINVSGAKIQLDWLRLHKLGTNATVTVTHTLPGNASVYWERVGTSVTGLIGSYPSGATVSVPTSALPPGQYRAYVVEASTKRYSPVITVHAIPQPVVLNPDFAGGTDYAATVRRDMWDFTQRGDFGTPTGVRTYSLTSGILNGTNSTNDPQVPLTMGAALNGTSYHRLTFRMYYDGPFGLANAPGGGCMVRVVWRTTASPSQWQESNDMVVFPGWNTITVDLHGASTKEPSSKQTYLGWGGRTIDRLRFDPNEDPGARTWHMDYVQVRDNDAGKGGFTFSYQDKAWKAGSSAKFYLDTDRTPGGTQHYLGSRSVASGVNTWAWSMPAGVPNGTYWVRMESTDGVVSALRYSEGPVRLVH